MGLLGRLFGTNNTVGSAGVSRPPQNDGGTGDKQFLCEASLVDPKTGQSYVGRLFLVADSLVLEGRTSIAIHMDRWDKKDVYTILEYGPVGTKVQYNLIAHDSRIKDTVTLASLVVSRSAAAELERRFGEYTTRRSEEQTKRAETELETVYAKVKQLFDDKEAWVLFLRYVERVEPSTLLDPDFIVCLEDVLKSRGARVCWTDGLLAAHCAVPRRTRSREAQEFYDSSFSLFIETLERMGLLDSSCTSSYNHSVVWLLVRDAFVRHHATVLQGLIESGHDSLILESLSLDAVLDAYCATESLDAGAARSVSQLACLVMNLGISQELAGTGHFEPQNYPLVRNAIGPRLSEAIRRQQLNAFSSALMSEESSTVTVDDVDVMTGLDFENLVARLFERSGYSVQVTPPTGDQGVDVIAERKGLRLGIQAKCYAGKVPNSAVQQIVAGLAHYGLQRGLVVTNGDFTPSAIELAESNNVTLWDREVLKRKLSELH